MTDQNGARCGANMGVILVTTLLALIFLYVWPGPLRFEYTYRDKGLFRIDRLTGGVTRYEDGRYVTARSIEPDMSGVTAEFGRKLTGLIQDLSEDKAEPR